MTNALAIRAYIDTKVGPKTGNFWLHVTEGMFASFAGVLISGGVVMPVLVGALGGKPWVLGVISSVGGFSVLAPLFFAPRVETVQRKKRLVLLLGIGQRLPLLFIAATLAIFAADSPFTCLIIIAVLNLISSVVVSILVPPWMDLIAETIPHDRQAKMFGFRNGISAAMGLMSSTVCYGIIRSVAFPYNYASLYFAAFLVMIVSWLLFALVDEAPPDAAGQRAPAKHYFRDLARVLVDDDTYRWYLSYQAANRIGLIAVPFYAYTAVSVYGVNEALAAGSFIALQQVSSMIGNFIFPFFAARIGNKRILIIGSVLHALAAVTAATAGSGTGFFVVFFIFGLANSTRSVSGAPFTMSVAPRGRRVGYITLSMVTLAPIAIVFSPLAGILLNVIGHGTLFALAGAVILSGVLPLIHCNPRHDSQPGQAEPDAEPSAAG